MNAPNIRRYVPLLSVLYVCVCVILEFLGYAQTAAALKSLGGMIDLESYSAVSPTEFLTAIGGVAGVFIKIRRVIAKVKNDDGSIKPRPVGPAIALAAFALLPTVAIAQDPMPSPTPKNAVTLSTGYMRFVTPGVRDAEDLEAHLEARVHTPAKTITEAFVRWTRTQGAAEGIAGLLDPKTFASVTAEISVSRPLNSYFDASCASGVSWNRDGEFDPRDPRLYTLGCGGRIRIDGKGSLSGYGGHNGTVGGWAAWGKLVIRQTDKVRYVATYAIPFQHPSRFRVNPGAFTFGGQVDLFTKPLPF